MDASRPSLGQRILTPSIITAVRCSLGFNIILTLVIAVLSVLLNDCKTRHCPSTISTSSSALTNVTIAEVNHVEPSITSRQHLLRTKRQADPSRSCVSWPNAKDLQVMYSEMQRNLKNPGRVWLCRARTFRGKRSFTTQMSLQSMTGLLSAHDVRMSAEQTKGDEITIVTH